MRRPVACPQHPCRCCLREPRLIVFLIVWFGVNLLFGLGIVSLPGEGDMPIAWEAHIGGFLAGLVTFALFDPHKLMPHQRNRLRRNTIVHWAHLPQPHSRRMLYHSLVRVPSECALARIFALASPWWAVAPDDGPRCRVENDVSGRRAAARLPPVKGGEPMTVKLILSRKSRDVATIEPTASLEAAITQLAQRRIGALVVLGPERRVVGILSERDIVECWPSKGRLC